MMHRSSSSRRRCSGEGCGGERPRERDRLRRRWRSWLLEDLREALELQRREAELPERLSPERLSPRPRLPERQRDDALRVRPMAANAKG